MLLTRSVHVTPFNTGALIRYFIMIKFAVTLIIIQTLKRCAISLLHA